MRAKLVIGVNSRNKREEVVLRQLLALGAAVSSMAAQNVGAGKMDRVNEVAKQGVIFLTSSEALREHPELFKAVIAEGFALGFVNPKLMVVIEKLARWHLANQVKDPVLREKLTPNYTIGCKRVLFSNNYYPALARDNVEVIAAGVKEVRANSVIDANGVEHEVDAIICGTGFDVADPLGPLKIYGRSGIETRETTGGMSAYLGTTLKDLPNLFMLLGPNTALGHNSIIFMIEQQIKYVIACLEEMDRKQAGIIEVKPAAEDAYNDKIQAELQKMVWSEGGCKSWYIDGETGRNFTIWPGFTWKYWMKMRKPNFRNFTFSKA